MSFGTQTRKENEDEISKGVIESALKKAFAPEFLNRIDDVVMFNTLARQDIHKIIDIELANLFGRVNGLGYSIKISDAAKDYIVEIEKNFELNNQIFNKTKCEYFNKIKPSKPSIV